jgi:hypothetical protein
MSKFRMLTNEFCVRGKFWEKDPHTHSPPPPPPPSKCGRCVQHMIIKTFVLIRLTQQHYSQQNPTLLPQNNILELYKKQPNSKQRITKREIWSGCEIQKRESLLMSKGVHSFGLDLSESE